MSKDKLELSLRHNYRQFDGIFFYWLYVSFNQNLVPKYFLFNLPDGRRIASTVEAIYYGANNGQGIESIKGTRAAQLLFNAYSAPDFAVVSTSKWHEKLIEHACQYYEDIETPYIEAEKSPFALSSERKPEQTLKESGFVKLLLLRKLDEKEVAGLDGLEESAGNKST